MLEGHWIRKKHTTRLICSNCGRMNTSKWHQYCYECGSKNDSIECEPNYMKTKENACECISCHKIVTDGKIFRLKERPERGLCFDCY